MRSKVPLSTETEMALDTRNVLVLGSTTQDRFAFFLSGFGPGHRQANNENVNLEAWGNISESRLFNQAG